MKRRSFDQSDHIRLKLQWLQRLSQSQDSIAERMFSSVPMLPLSIALIAGILIAGYPPAVFVYGGVLICLSAGIVVLCFFLKFSDKTKLYLTFAVAVLAFICLGAIRVAYIQYRPPHHISHFLKTDRELATLRGRIISPIQINDSNRGFGSIPWLASQASFYLSVTDIKTASGWRPACGRVRVQVAEPVSHAQPGNDVQLYCWLSRFAPPPNPGQFDLQNYMSSRGVFVAASVSIKEGVEVIRNSRSILFYLRSLLYRFAADALLDETATNPDVQSLVSTLLLGVRSDLDPVLVSAFQKTNLAHHISLSGMHIAILAGSLWLVLRTAQIPKRPRAVLCIILILMYAMIVPPRAATMRAIVMSCFFFASATIYRPVHPLNTLALSAAAMLLVRPYELFDAGWQLSFMSVLGILVLYKPAQYLLLDRLFYPLVPFFRSRFIPIQYSLYYVLDALAVGLGAWIAIAPILLYYFGLVNPWSPLWTVITSAPIFVMLYAGFLKMALAPLLPTVASVLGAILAFCSTVLEKMVLALAKINFLQTPSHRPSLFFIFVLYGLMLTAWFIPHRYGRLRKILLLLLVIGLFFPGLTQIKKWINNPTLEMTCLSVGHGQAVVLSMPGDRHILFDAGSITNQDVARKIVAPYLLHRSIFELDALFISHGDMDHLNAIPDVAAAVPVRYVYGNAALLENTIQPSLEKQLQERLKKIGRPLEPIQNRRYDNVKIQSLWPTQDVLLDKGISENDRSEIILIEYAGRKILLCGDIERYAQEKFPACYPDLKIDVMVLPHHGSTVNLDTNFVEQLSPFIVIASCSSKNAPNAYRPPNNSQIQPFYTAFDGAVTVKIKADGTLGAAGFLNSQ